MQSLDGRACAAAAAHLRQLLDVCPESAMSLVQVCSLRFANCRTPYKIFGCLK